MCLGSGFRAARHDFSITAYKFLLSCFGGLRATSVLAPNGCIFAAARRLILDPISFI